MIAGRQFSISSLIFPTFSVHKHWKLLFQAIFSVCIESKPGKQKNGFSSEQKADFFALQNNKDNDPCKQNFGQISLWKWSRLVMSNSLQPRGLKPTRLLCPWDSPGKNTGVGCHFLLQGIFPTQGLNPGLPHCKQML